MGVTINMKSTSSDSFMIGKRGITIYQGVDYPINAVGKDGDLYIMSGNDEGLYQRVSGIWICFQLTNDKLKNITDFNLKPNTFIISDGNNLVLQSAYQTRNALGLGSAATLNVGTTTGTIPVLDSTGKIPSGLIPVFNISNVYTVQSDAEKTSLNANTGDVVIVISTGLNYIWNSSEWIQISQPNNVLSVAGKTGSILLDTTDLISGTLPPERGGTGLSQYSTGDMIYFSSTNNFQCLNIGENNSILKIINNIPSWSTIDPTDITYSASNKNITVSNIKDAIDLLFNNKQFVYTSSTIPIATNDSNDTASIGVKFNIGDVWINTLTETFYFCISNTVNSASWIKASVAGISSIDDDKTPLLGGDLDVNHYSIISKNGNDINISSSNNITIDAKSVKIGKSTYPVNDGTNNQVLKTNGNGSITWQDETGEINTLESLGTSDDGFDITGEKIDKSLTIKRIMAGNNIFITENKNNIVISANNVGGNSVGVNGANIYAGMSGNILQFKKIISGANIDITEDNNYIYFSIPLANVAKTGKYSDLSNTPVLSTVATSGKYNDLSNKPTLGTVAAKDTGINSGNIPILNSNGKLDNSIIDQSIIENILIITDETTEITLDNYIIIINKATPNATVLTIPYDSNLKTGKCFIIKDGKGDASINNITIQPANNKLIDGKSSYIINTSYDSITIIWTGTSWNIISKIY